MEPLELPSRYKIDVKSELLGQLHLIRKDFSNIKLQDDQSNKGYSIPKILLEPLKPPTSTVKMGRPLGKKDSKTFANRGRPLGCLDSHTFLVRGRPLGKKDTKAFEIRGRPKGKKDSQKFEIRGRPKLISSFL